MCASNQVWIAIGILDSLTLICASILIQHQLLCLFFQLLHRLLLRMRVKDILLLSESDGLVELLLLLLLKIQILHALHTVLLRLHLWPIGRVCLRLSLSLHRDELLRHLVVKAVHVIWICSRGMLSYWPNISETSYEILLEPW